MAVVTQFQFRRGTAAQWTSANPTLASGEFGYETDTGKAKIGDGSTAWTSLGYAVGAGVAVGSITGLGTGVATWLATPSSANLASAVTDETGSGSLVFGTTPTIATPTLTLSTTSSTTSARISYDSTNKKIQVGDGTNALDYASSTLQLNAQTGTTYTFVLGDKDKLVTASNAAAQTYSIPTNASVAYPTGTQINIIAIGAGQVTINAVTPATTTVASTGATATAPKLRAQYSSATLIKVATDTWYVIGDLA